MPPTVIRLTDTPNVTTAVLLIETMWSATRHVGARWLPAAPEVGSDDEEMNHDEVSTVMLLKTCSRISPCQDEVEVEEEVEEQNAAPKVKKKKANTDLAAEELAAAAVIPSHDDAVKAAVAIAMMHLTSPPMRSPPMSAAQREHRRIQRVHSEYDKFGDPKQPYAIIGIHPRVSDAELKKHSKFFENSYTQTKIGRKAPQQCTRSFKLR